jgi:hypothetical protein
MGPYRILNIDRFPVHLNDNGFFRYSQREMSLADRGKDEGVLQS